MLENTDITLSWIVTDNNPVWHIIFSYEMVYDEALMQWVINLAEHKGFWFSNFPITLNIDWLDLGKYTYTCMVADAAGPISSHTVIIQVVETLTTTSTTPTTTETTTITQTPTTETTTIEEIKSALETSGWIYSLTLTSILIFVILQKKIKH